MFVFPGSTIHIELSTTPSKYAFEGLRFKAWDIIAIIAAKLVQMKLCLFRKTFATGNTILDYSLHLYVDYKLKSTPNSFMQNMKQ